MSSFRSLNMADDCGACRRYKKSRLIMFAAAFQVSLRPMVFVASIEVG